MATYPVPLMNLFVQECAKHRYSASAAQSWSEAIQAVNPEHAQWLTEEVKRIVAHNLLKDAIKSISINAQEDFIVGMVYSSRMYVFDERALLDVLYKVYIEGQSDWKRRFPHVP